MLLSCKMAPNYMVVMSRATRRRSTSCSRYAMKREFGRWAGRARLTQAVKLPEMNRRSVRQEPRR